MEITRDTKLRDLLQAHPYLLEFLATYRPAFEKLRNPVLRNTVGAVATLSTVAEMGDVAADTLIADIRARIASEEGGGGIAGSGSTGVGVQSATDSAETGRGRRTEMLKGIIRELHAGASVDDVKERFDVLVGEVGADGIAQVEQSLIAEGMPVEEIRRLCDVHVSVFKEALERTEDAAGPTEWPAGHPLDTFERENERIIELTSRLRCSAETAEADHVAFMALVSDLNELAAIDLHFLRKENQLFPLLERHGITGPTKVMWAIDDDIRDLLKDVRATAEAGDVANVVKALPMLLKMIDDMVYKERKILFPLSAETLAEEEWREVARGEHEIGFAWVEPAADWAGAATTGGEAPRGLAEGIPLTTGLLSLAQLDAMVRALPFDLTYVDEEDRVRFYSEGDRVFPRSPAVIGRRVADCHPPKSVDIVLRILDAFKAGEKDVAEFWIELGGKFIHIRYLALRDTDGMYRGTLEVVQDATHVRGLEGQRRLLDW